MSRGDLQRRVGDIIFETDTPASRAFDVALLWAILISVALVMLDSVAAIRSEYGRALRVLEWGFTLLFTTEYLLRLWVAYDRRRYATSFYGLVDLLAVLPTYLSLVFLGSQYLIVIRGLRLLRVFRVLKLMRFLGEASVLARALLASRAKITVFLVGVLTMVVIIGAAMFMIEGPRSGFVNIPISVYWAIVTLTTVGYGDIVPQTAFGKFLASVVMILGYGIIAVPTGIVTSELSRADRGRRSEPEHPTCDRCGLETHDADARFCKRCGEALPETAR